ncbi:hypothetical protein BCV70DRAFT_199772 [Testicularia cyperi]|uniref:Uncharacterized protein n=1 Tax=Testicularia cyperi TaxID=1882483 RepID=A0A317XRR8_9BASI|nr:hypothetical protein BCV70DRAFT_199772 [Testicularia cyperi]
MGSSSSKPARKLGSTVSQAVSRNTPSAPSAAQTAQRVARDAAGTPSPSPTTSASPSATKAQGEYAPSGTAFREQETQRQQAQSSETKSADIMRDAYDPQFLQNLSRLGQVKVPKNATNYEPTDQMLRILHAREQASMESLQNIENFGSASRSTGSSQKDVSSSHRPARVSANTITLLLDDRKHCETRADLEKLAVEYDLPLETIETLGRYYNSPTMGEEIRDDDSTRQEDRANRQDERGPPKVYGVWVEPTFKSSQPRP